MAEIKVDEKKVSDQKHDVSVPASLVPKSEHKIEMLIAQEGAVALIVRGWKSKDQAKLIFDELNNCSLWEQQYVSLPVGMVAQPRLTFNCGDHPGMTMDYGGRKFAIGKWIKVLEQIRNDILHEFKIFFDACHTLKYRDGKDSISMHSDRESLGNCNAVYALSLGASREFIFKSKAPIGVSASGRRRFQTIKTMISNGDLMAMFGKTQDLWLHGIDKTDQPVGVRIACTYRLLHPDLAPKFDWSTMKAV